MGLVIRGGYELIEMWNRVAIDPVLTFLQRSILIGLWRWKHRFINLANVFE